MRCFPKFLCLKSGVPVGGKFLVWIIHLGPTKITHTQTWPKNHELMMTPPFKKTSTKWFKVSFRSPSWRSLNHPKKVTLNHQESWSWWIATAWNFPPLQFISPWLHSSPCNLRIIKGVGTGRFQADVLLVTWPILRWKRDLYDFWVMQKKGSKPRWNELNSFG